MATLLENFITTRERTLELCKELEPEDFNLQGEDFTSPVKWHLAHSSWFFETMVLNVNLKEYRVYDPKFAYLFNSYYNTLGKRVLRKNRGLLSRPGIERILEYRKYVDRYIRDLLQNNVSQETTELIELGIQHEQQHQELLQTDLKYSLSLNPIHPILDKTIAHWKVKNTEVGWKNMTEGIYEIGASGENFCFDNELNRHKVYLNEFNISKSLVTNGEYIDFIESGGYQKFEYWLDEAWTWVQNEQVTAPLYWSREGDKWMHYTLSGLKEIDKDAILNHVSYYEAMAYATWKGFRLATEFEWEAASDSIPWGDRWEWTNSAYLPYPGFIITEGAVGEYNGKFMINQMVLRGASSATTPGHSRNTYRNFFHPHFQWQFTGIRLVK